MLRSGQRDIKQSLHFLPLDDFQFFLEFVRIRFVENDLAVDRARGLDQARVARARAPDFAGEKGHDHGLPFRALGFVRGDQLDGVGCRGIGFANRLVAGAQAGAKSASDMAARFRRGGRAEQFVQLRAQIGKVFRGSEHKRSRSCVMRTISWTALKSGCCLIARRKRVEQIQRVRDRAASARFLCDLETRPGALGEARQLVIGEAEDFAQHAHDFVVGVGSTMIASSAVSQA